MKNELCNKLWVLIQNEPKVDITKYGVKSYRITKNIESGRRFTNGIRVITFYGELPNKSARYFQGEFMECRFLRWCMTRLTKNELRFYISMIENKNTQQ